MLSSHYLAEFSGTDAVFFDQCTGLRTDDPFDIIMGGVEELLHQGLAGVGERAMADIMEEAGGDDESTVLVGKTETAGCNVGKEHGTKRVFEPRVIGPGIDEIGKTELPDVAQTLQSR